jgi:hypothetical protein
MNISLPEEKEKRAAAFLFFLFTAATLHRILFITSYAGSWDAIDFALALERYDIFAMQPHFPGYPVFIITAKLILPLLDDPVQALSLVSAIFGGLSILGVFGLARNMTNDPYIGLIAASLYSFNPLISLTHVQPMSDSMGLFFAISMFYVASISLRHKAGAPIHFSITIWTCMIYAVAMGVRISYFPLLLVVLLPIWKMRPTRLWLLKVCITAIAGLLAGLSWLLPTAYTEGGLSEYFVLAKAFTGGHFQDWGGTIVTEAPSAAQWGERIARWFWHQMLWAGWLGEAANQWGIHVVPGLLLLSVASVVAVTIGSRIVTIRENEKSAWQYGLLAVIPYLFWLFIGQNPDKPRHILPLLPFFVIGLSWVLGQACYKWPRYRLFIIFPVIVYLIGSLFQSTMLMKENFGPSPALQMAHYVKASYKPEDVIIFTWEEERTFQYYAEGFAVQRVKSYSLFEQLKREYGENGRAVLISSKVIEGFGARYPYELKKHLIVKKEFLGHPVVFPVYHHLILYEWKDKISNETSIRF